MGSWGENHTANGLISIVIPTLNEERGIDRTINEIPVSQIEKLGYNCEIIIVDGNSSDMTRRIGKEAGAKVIVEQTPGYGRAYMTGFEHAQGGIIVTLDGDFSYPAYLIPNLVKLLEEENLDFVSTNRFAHLKKETMNSLHIIGNRLLTHFTRTLFSIDMRDSQSGMWVFRKAILNKMDLHAYGMAFSEEIKLHAFRKFKAKEVPIEYRKRIGKQKVKTFTDGFRNLLYLFKLRKSTATLEGGRKPIKGSLGGVRIPYSHCDRTLSSSYWRPRKPLL